MKKILTLICIIPVVISGYSVIATTTYNNSYDIDPLVDISLTIDISAIRALDKIERCSDPDFFINIILYIDINNINSYINRK